MAPFAPPTDEALIAGYEEVRRQALTEHGGTGLALLIRRGMREWMHACSHPNSPQAAKAYARTEVEPVIPQALQPEIVLILAGMLLHGFQEACT
jgi:hypothetical protein